MNIFDVKYCKVCHAIDDYLQKLRHRCTILHNALATDNFVKIYIVTGKEYQEFSFIFFRLVTIYFLYRIMVETKFHQTPHFLNMFLPFLFIKL